ncbi:MAG: hypothetical protein CMD25_00305 [Flavobacteriales bacterium]|nr:hypothetical protein [Flavobacteriales bacterium]|tara:strand:- start:2320 stop:2628 length:309 start_codon:yes stop_codon:yes gene_type:complete
MAKTWKQISATLNEAKFKLPRDQKEVKKETQKVAGKTLDIRFGEDKRGKIHVYIDGVSMGDPYMNMKAADKEMKNIKNVIRQMGEENISKEEILGVINEINI